MDNPVKEIPKVIHALTQGSQDEQKRALDTFFMPNSAFVHPFCRVDSFSEFSVPFVGEVNSRWIIWMIYRWYKFLSPNTIIDVHSAVLDDVQNTLFVQVSQVFFIWFIPFYKANVRLVVELQLVQSSDKKYFICKQEDHYQVNEFIKFLWPFGTIAVTLWQYLIAFFCILASMVFTPSIATAHKKEL